MIDLPAEKQKDPRARSADLLSAETRRLLEHVASADRVSLYDRPAFMIGSALAGLAVSVVLVWFVYGPHGLLSPMQHPSHPAQTKAGPQARASP